MKTQLFLIAVCITASTTSQALYDAVPAWNFGNFPTWKGTQSSTKTPRGEHISKINLYKGVSSNGDFGGIQVFYGTTPNASPLAKYDENTGLFGSGGSVSTTVI
jgi:hypothetical protein